MPAEFISLTYPNASTELSPIPKAGIDNKFLVRYARAVEDAGFDYTLLPYSSSSFDNFTIAATISQHTEKVRPIVALRPNTVYPTVAARSLATLDQLSDGRAVLHVIAGGSNQEQAREGDFLSKAARYERAEEYIGILRRAWREHTAFDHRGKYYEFEDFRNDVHPVNGTIPVSIGGSSDAAYRIGGESADIFGLWGEPLAETAEQIASVDAAAAAVGRKDRPRYWVTFRPIIAPTEELAWEKAKRVLTALEQNAATNSTSAVRPENVGSQRLLDIAARGEVHDRALWTAPATVTNAQGASTALVGTPETVAAAILDYVDLGATLVSIRGYDNYNDVIDYGRYVLPLIRQELAQRERTSSHH
ncbi:LLM class flavin-dependent oxidoreductase [Rhodococcus globerulus]|uniref:LLM class flavin-dependent oxidoreductase n=1 Tax=Rhodococcus globerulus TaxID=33008 RepID=A0ABU4C4M6_RHOGO|nr:LLM class flavin-dependent oxidoreductase [Rhodococcus globerulus]MDV6271442.1 LLM class flavin-dependent oxidoreductase [Rhodococcus globerulus]